MLALGITDHDTVAGLDEALAAGQVYGVRVIPGVELSTEWQEREIHILGYYINWQDGDLQAYLAGMRRDRQRRTARMVQRLEEMGYGISMAEVEREVQGEAIGRPHIAAALVSQGYVPSVEAAFQTLLARGRPAYVPRTRVLPARAVEIILAAGGVPVLAHPGLSQADDLIPSLANRGLQGIEAYYPCHDCIATRRYLELADEYNLVITGGSDYHGLVDSSHADLGSCQVGLDVVELLQQRAQRIKTGANPATARQGD
ncbi:MAG: 3,5-nucleoside bisphosphate phosphatase [Clostridia bacterium]|nr:3,5-nucleoside bisphosphate phosphatase [Clostridia bacterium]